MEVRAPAFDRELEPLRRSRLDWKPWLGWPFGLPPTWSREQVIAEEERHLRMQRRRVAEPLVGIALSGGGVRSATVSLGFLKELFRSGAIDHVDYLSTVSGAGYASGYLYASISDIAARPHGEVILASDEARHETLFGTEALDSLRKAGKYLNLGGGIASFFRAVQLVAAVLSTLVLHIGWVATLLAALVSAIVWADRSYLHLPKLPLGMFLVVPFLRLLALPGVGRGRLFVQVSRAVNWIEGFALLLAGALLLRALGIGIADGIANFSALPWGPHERAAPLVCIVAFLALGTLASPDVMGLFAVFRERIAKAYLRTRNANRWSLTPLYLRRLVGAVAPRRMPYPLFNCCVYLRDDEDTQFSGMQTVDYFLLSPLACGSKLTHYVSTEASGRGYRRVTLADAVTASAASITPLMNGNANGAVALAFWTLNLNLGTWMKNPKATWPRLTFFWPVHYLRLLLGRLNTKASLVSVADGGFIDNLGVFELLRRRCQLIICVDNTYDPHYEFKHLRNLITRARVELAHRISFRQDPEQELRPAAATGFARRQYVVADVESVGDVPPMRGVLVYVKACVLVASAEVGRRQDGDQYWTYHSGFPQESTADQFFDEDQWSAYFTLGRRMYGEVFDVDVFGAQPRALDRDQLLQRFAIRVH
jgi:hypothetical protein